MIDGIREVNEGRHCGLGLSSQGRQPGVTMSQGINPRCNDMTQNKNKH